MIKNTKLMLGIFLFLIVFFSNFVFAFGVSSGYYEGKPLILHQGEEKIVKLVLQNMGGSDEEIRAELNSGDEIASLEKTDYIVKRGTADTLVPIKIIAPSDVPINTTYRVSVSFKTLAAGSGGVAMGMAISNGFDVMVIGKEKKPISNILILSIIIAMIAVAVIVALIIKKRSSEKKFNKF